MKESAENENFYRCLQKQRISQKDFCLTQHGCFYTVRVSQVDNRTSGLSWEGRIDQRISTCSLQLYFSTSTDPASKTIKAVGRGLLPPAISEGSVADKR